MNNKLVKDLIVRVESEINKTPTGDLRNLLCDVNIALHSNETPEDKFSTEYGEEFFEWLRSINKLDAYEAMLDFSVDYAGDQELRLQATEDLHLLKMQYKNRDEVKKDEKTS